MLLLHQPPWLGALHSHMLTQSIRGDFYVPVFGFSLRLCSLPFPWTLSDHSIPIMYSDPCLPLQCSRLTQVHYGGRSTPSTPRTHPDHPLLACSPITSPPPASFLSCFSPLAAANFFQDSSWFWISAFRFLEKTHSLYQSHCNEQGP